MKDKELIGATVELLQDIRTIGGDVFKKGDHMKIYGAWRGRFQLHALTPTGRVRVRRGCAPGVRQVDRRKFIVIRSG